MTDYVTKAEFNTSMSKIDQKFDESTDTMLKQFDRMYDYMNPKFDAIDRRFEAIDMRFNRIDYNISILDGNMRSMASYMNLIGRKLGINDELIFKTA